jgi:hypothetical protein
MIANSCPPLGWLAAQAEPVARNTREANTLGARSFDQQQLGAVSLDP